MQRFYSNFQILENFAIVSYASQQTDASSKDFIHSKSVGTKYTWTFFLRYLYSSQILMFNKTQLLFKINTLVINSFVVLVVPASTSTLSASLALREKLY